MLRFFKPSARRSWRAPAAGLAAEPADCHLERALRRHHGRAAPRDRERRRGHPRRPHRGRRHQGRDRPQFPAPAAPGPARRHPRARPDQYPHARGHVAVPRHRRRHAPAGLAGEIHLSGRSQERHRRFRPLGHAPGAASKCCSPAPPLTPTCTTSRTSSRRPPKRPACAACWARPSSASRSPDYKTPADALACTETFIKRFGNDPLIVAGRRAARASTPIPTIP